MPPRSPLKGDRNQRVTVPLPPSLNELESTAKNAFGPGYRFKMYHRGETVLENQQQFRNVGDQDLVIIRKETPDTGGDPTMRNMRTTHQTAFVKHPLEPRRPPQTPPARPDVKAPAFQGRSCYAGDYVEHPMDSPGRTPRTVAAWEPNSIPMNSRSTYTENFPWHALQPKTPSLRPERGASHTVSAPPFHGQTSYKIDYVKHDAKKRPSSAAGPRKKDMREDPNANVPFNGTTTYTTDYKKHLMDKQQKRAGPWKQEPGPSPPFQGNSEYKNQYIKKEKPRGPLVHLEPEDKQRRSS